MNIEEALKIAEQSKDSLLPRGEALQVLVKAYNELQEKLDKCQVSEILSYPENKPEENKEYLVEVKDGEYLWYDVLVWNGSDFYPKCFLNDNKVIAFAEIKK